MNLSHKTILVTGATGGIGREVSRLLAAQGARLVLNCLNTELLDKLAAELGPAHRRISADVATSQGRDAIVDACQTAGGIDAIVNLAGILDFDLFVHQPVSVIETLLMVNTVGPVLLTRQLLPQLLARPASRIVNVGSIFGSIGHPGFVAYCTSKAALKSFSEALARELADTHVSVAYIAPRATRTALNNDRVTGLNIALGNKSDEPSVVAREIVKLLAGDRPLRYLGWPEKLFVYINAVLPALVHSALVRKLPLIKKFAQV